MNSEDASLQNTKRQETHGKFDSSSDLPEIRDVVSLDGDGNEAIDPPGPGADVSSTVMRIAKLMPNGCFPAYG
jgi:hypothetical protein